MPLGIGPMEIVVVLVIALLVIGPKKLPDMAKSMGSGLREFKDSLSGESDERDAPAQVAPVASAPRNEAV
ncbi:twin-arginine translocase TatA/TatE family subunit [Patulibacter sp.]|uniref:twin-arginine translocase TatA/TatE family subunit n=1 Tax=Patulibacter sp. TaxID=1912859 RepID=UPI0027223FFF|nr:twin-arginine translocase TatA/TatE family subunit [Patulibacter sp.]MDO9408392.1 twin-arginine translocase TatA/TatE family subunit [Patulibacter sp.]